jgi:integrase
MAPLTVKRIELLIRRQEWGSHRDERNLFLDIRSATSLSWNFRYEFGGRPRNMGLGSYPTVTLLRAREKAIKARRQIDDGIDPLEAKQREKAAQQYSKTFKDAAAGYLNLHRAEWSAKHREQYESRIATYAVPKIGRQSVASITTDDVLRVLRQKHAAHGGKELWTATQKSADRLRGWIASILDYAHEWNGANPARWRGHLEHKLSSRQKFRDTDHHPALPYAQMYAFMTELRTMPGIAARALEFLILTCTRTEETLGARWDELSPDWDKIKEPLLVIPGERMKEKQEHIVPLTPPVIELLKAVPPMAGNPYIFPGMIAGKGLNSDSLLALLDRMERKKRWLDKDGRPIVVHGFRRTFKNWASACTPYPREVIEAALSHVVGSTTERSYQDENVYLPKLWPLLCDWATFCAKPPAAIESLTAARVARTG